MKMIIVCGWDIGFQKVGFTQMLRRELGYSLSKAKAKTDAILDDKSWSFPISDERFVDVLSQLTLVGAKVTVKDLVTSTSVVSKPAARAKSMSSGKEPTQPRENSSAS